MLLWSECRVCLGPFQSFLQLAEPEVLEEVELQLFGNVILISVITYHEV